jgi:UDP-glucuronate 4-epimerase
VRLLEYVEALEECLGRTAIKEMLPLQPGDIPDTFADVTALARAVNYKPSVPVKEGVRRFVDWYLQYYRVTAP